MKTSIYNNLYSNIFQKYSKATEKDSENKEEIQESQKEGEINSSDEQEKRDTFNRNSIINNINCSSNNIASIKEIKLDQSKFLHYIRDEHTLIISSIIYNYKLFDTFQEVHRLEFDLKNKEINDVSIQGFLQNLMYFAEKKVKSLKVDFSKNPHVTDRGMYDFMTTLPKFTRLEKVSILIDYCNVSDFSLKQLTGTFKFLTLLKEIYISANNCPVTEESIKYLFKTFSETSVVVDLDINNFSELPKFKKVNESKKKELKKQDKMNQHHSKAENDVNCSLDYCTTDSNLDCIQAQSSLPQKINSKQVPQSSHSPSLQKNVFKECLKNSNPIIKQSQPVQQEQDTASQNNLYKLNSENTIFTTNSKTVFQNIDEDQKRKSPQEEFAEKQFEQEYGKGFKLLQKGGYKIGTGLGKNNEGIIEPVKPLIKNKFIEKTKSIVHSKEKSYFEELAKGSNSTKNAFNKIVKFEKKSIMKIGEKSIDKDKQVTNQEKSKESITPSNANLSTDNQRMENNNKSASKSSSNPIGNTGSPNSNASQNSNTLIFNTVVNVNLSNSQQNTQINSQQNNIQNSGVKEQPGNQESSRNGVDSVENLGCSSAKVNADNQIEVLDNKENLDPQLCPDKINMQTAQISSKIQQQQLITQQVAQSIQSSAQIINPYQQALQLNPFQQALKPQPQLNQQFLPYQQYIGYGQQPSFFYQHPNRIQGTQQQQQQQFY